MPTQIYPIRQETIGGSKRVGLMVLMAYLLQSDTLDQDSGGLQTLQPEVKRTQNCVSAALEVHPIPWHGDRPSIAVRRQSFKAN